MFLFCGTWEKTAQETQVSSIRRICSGPRKYLWWSHFAARCRLQEWNFTIKEFAKNVLANFSKKLFFRTHCNRYCTGSKKCLTYFMPLISFYIPWKHYKTFGFSLFSGGIERDQWHEMGYKQKTLTEHKIFSKQKQRYPHNMTNLNMSLLQIWN